MATADEPAASELDADLSYRRSYSEMHGLASLEPHSSAEATRTAP